MSNQKEYPKLTMEQTIDLVIAGKSAEGLRERTLRDYRKDWKYFVTWLERIMKSKHWMNFHLII